MDQQGCCISRFHTITMCIVYRIVAVSSLTCGFGGTGRWLLSGCGCGCSVASHWLATGCDFGCGSCCGCDWRCCAGTSWGRLLPSGKRPASGGSWRADSAGGAPAGCAGPAAGRPSVGSGSAPTAAAAADRRRPESCPNSGSRRRQVASPAAAAAAARGAAAVAVGSPPRRTDGSAAPVAAGCAASGW